MCVCMMRARGRKAMHREPTSEEADELGVYEHDVLGATPRAVSLSHTHTHTHPL